MSSLIKETVQSSSELLHTLQFLSTEEINLLNHLQNNFSDIQIMIDSDFKMEIITNGSHAACGIAARKINGLDIQLWIGAHTLK